MDIADCNFYTDKQLKSQKSNYLNYSFVHDLLTLIIDVLEQK